jgi:hypothetical protein
MKHRWTMKELDEATDNQILLTLVNERLNDLNPYAPLAVRLKKVRARLERAPGPRTSVANVSNWRERT